MYHDYSMEKIMEHVRAKNIKKKYILDTDAYNEVDDQFAITYAMLAQNIDLLALCAAPFSNQRSTGPADGMEKSYHEMVKVRDLVDPENKMNIPCYRGSTEYMKNIITPVKSEAAENIVRLVKETDDIVYVAVIGCFTNVASALLLDPSIADKMVVIMLGGAKFELGHANDFNLLQDRAAARVIFECGVPVVVFPAVGGVTDTLYISNAELDYYLKGKAGKIGDLLYNNFVEEELDPVIKSCDADKLNGGLAKLLLDYYKMYGEFSGYSGFCNCSIRPIFDIAAVAFIREPGAFGAKIVPAKSIDDKGLWRDLNEDRNMIYIEDLYRNYIVSDMFTVITNADLK